jgi:hypothetical protein
MRSFLASVLVAILLCACGGGGGNPGQCSGSPQFCAEFGDGTGGSGTGGGGSVTPLFTRSGTGDAVFDLPTGVTRVRIRGTFAGTSLNFVVRIAGSVAVNTPIGTAQTPPAFDGEVPVAAGSTVEIIGATGITWSIEQLP